MRTVNCRARTSASCFHGHPVDQHYDPPDYDVEDGTFQHSSLSVVCDACYVELIPLTPSGQGLIHELDFAIQEARERIVP
jgi:hypothetical protein